MHLVELHSVSGLGPGEAAQTLCHNSGLGAALMDEGIVLSNMWTLSTKIYTDITNLFDIITK